MLPASEEAEIREIAARLGTPLRWRRAYEASNPHNATWARRMMRRRGEAILVIPRPAGRVLLHTKSTYPEGVYRLPGGGIDPGEAAVPAARRELLEETGFDLPLERFLGVVENEFLVNGDRLAYPSYVFLVAETADAPRVMDPHEAITGFREEPIESLMDVVADLEKLPTDWQPWGAFRAAPHALALAALGAAKS